MSHASRPYNCSFPLKPLAAAVLLACAPGLGAAPNFASSPTQNVTVNQDTPNTTVVTQSSDRALANWNDFSIMANETVRFVQPNANSVILNHVLGTNVSEILGKLIANGRVFLINPNGIVFGANSEVNVGTLVASTLTLKSGSQANSDLIEFEASNNAGEIVVQGVIEAMKIALLAPQIRNSGLLRGRTGDTGVQVSLLAAKDVNVNTQGGDLVLNVTAGYEGAVINQLGSVLTDGGQIVLLARAEAGGPPSVINTAGVQQASQISITGDRVQLSGAINTGAGAASQTTVTAGEITQGTSLQLGGQLDLTADTVTLNNIGNNFMGTVSLVDAGSVTLVDADQLTVSGKADSVSLNAQSINALDLTVAGNMTTESSNLVLEGVTVNKNLGVTAQSVTQGGNQSADRVVVGGSTNFDLSGKASVVLGNQANDFKGQVTLGNAVDVTLRDANSLSVTGKAGTGNLGAQAVTLTGMEVTGDLSVQSKSVSLAGLSVGNNLNLAAQTVTQSDGNANKVSVGGQTTLDGVVTATLNNKANDFSGLVTLNDAGAVSLTDVNNLQLTGKSASVVANAQTIGLSDLSTTGNLVANSAGSLNLGRVDVGGQLTVSASSVSQSVNAAQQLTVAGSTKIDGAASVNLINQANDFKGGVTLSNAGNVQLTDANALTVGGVANTVTATAGTLSLSGLSTTGNVAAAADNLTLGKVSVGNQFTVNAKTVVQSDTASQNLTVSGDTVLNKASSVTLGNSANDFNGTVTLNDVGSANLRDANSLTVVGKADTANLSAQSLNVAGLNASNAALDSKTVSLSGLVIGNNLIVSAETVTQGNAAGEQVFVGGSTTISKAGNVSLNNAGNDFNQRLTLTDTGTVSVRDSNQLDVAGKTASASLAAQNLVVGGLVVTGDLTGTANSMALGGLEVGGDFTANTASLVQDKQPTENLRVAGNTILNNVAIVSLDNAANNFTGTVNLNNVGTAVLADANALRVSGSVNTATLNAQSLNVGGLTVQGDLTANAGSVTQGTAGNQALVVGGNTRLNSAGSVNLSNTANDFKGAVFLSNAGTVTLLDSNALAVQGNVNSTSLTAQSLTMSGLSSGALNATANNVSLSGVAVSGNLTVTAESVSQGNLAGDQLTVGGASTFNNLGGNKAVVALDHTANDFKGLLTLNDVGGVTVRDANQLSVAGKANEATLSAQALNLSGLTVVNNLTVNANTLGLGRLNVGGDFTSNAQLVSQGTAGNQSLSITGDTVLNNAVTVQLNNTANQFGGDVVLNKAGNVELAYQNELNVRGQADALSLVSSAQNPGALVLGELTVGELNTQVADIRQTGELLRVSGDASLQGRNIDLQASTNDFEGNVDLNASGQVSLRDANNLQVSGEIGGAGVLVAQSIGQLSTKEGQLQTSSGLDVQAASVQLDNSGNRLDGVLHLEGATQATVASLGRLEVTGKNLGDLNATADELVLGALGELNSLQVQAGEVGQSASLVVQNETRIQADRINLNNDNNDFAGDVVVQGKAQSVPVVSIADKNDLTLVGKDFTLAAKVQGDLNVRAEDVVLNRTQVTGDSTFTLTGGLSQNAAVDLNNANITASQVNLANSGNRFTGTTRVDSPNQVTLATAENIDLVMAAGTGPLALTANRDANVTGQQVVFARSTVRGDLQVNANQIGQQNALQVDGDTTLAALGGAIQLTHAGNRFDGTVSMNAEETTLNAAGDLQLLDVSTRGGQITAGDKLVFLGRIEQLGGTLDFTANGLSRPLSSADIARLLPPALDVYSAKEAVDPITGLSRITVGSPVIEQRAGQIVSSAGSVMRFNSPGNGSVFLTRNNLINGQLTALSGQRFNTQFAYQAQHGASVFAVNNEVKLNIGGAGVEADLVSIRARGLATVGPDATIRARMPYNDIAVGAARSYAGLALSIPLTNVNGVPSGVSEFGDASGGQAGGNGAIRVEVGDLSRPALGGFLTVLPFEGTNLLPGQIVYLSGPERRGTQAFFYDGARNLSRIPVVYNGSLLLSPQESAALTTAQGAVVLARQEQTRSVVRTENVAGKIINGVVLEVGPGRPATEGSGEASKPESCEAVDTGLGCATP